jgi:hypothetical protein
VSDRCRIAYGRPTRQTATVAQTTPLATLGDLVGAALEQRRGALATLVHERVTALVDELVELELNGHADHDDARELTTDPPLDPPASKICTACGEEKPADKFERHRNVCRSCRWKAERERRDRTEESPAPLAGPGSSDTGSVAATTPG